MHVKWHQKTSKAFALPTVLIASVVLLMILAVSVNATAAARTALQNQYYIQLAQVAGEAGVADAKACLAASGNIPTWTNAQPLTPATDCSGNIVGGASCPTDSRCSVTVDGNVRSSFSVPLPTVDSQGRALTIPNTGYVSLTRESNGAVWRTYQQPSVQNAVVPDLCSGNATSARGWSAAVVSSSQDALPSATAAQSITLQNPTVIGGQMYFRKDFNVVNPGSYSFNLLTTNSLDIADGYIDNQYIASASGELANTSTTLTAGCHTLLVRLTQAGTIARASDFTFSLNPAGSTVPLIVSDTTWRVSSGDAMQFSQANYYEAPSTWDQVVDYGSWANTTLPWGGSAATWQSVSGDAFSNWITTQPSSGGYNRPGGSYAWLRQATPFTLAAATNIRVTSYCDDQCILYLDGLPITSLGTGAGVVSKMITIQAGTHTFGLQLYNGSTAPNPSALLFAAVNPTTGAVIARSDAGWDATNFWATSAASQPYAYDETFQPTPNSLGTTTVKALVVGGGGDGGSGYEGGGGGAGGFIYDAAHPVTAGTYLVTVGAGGAGGAVGAANQGGYSVFDNLRAVGGGYGANEPNGSGGLYGLPGGSGGGSAHPWTTAIYSGAFLQGNNGGAGITGNPYVGGGGGGYGGAGQNATTAKAGDGGVGWSNSITGSAVFYAGGGGGAFRSGTNGAGGNGGGGAGSSTTGASGAANTGGGGGAGGNSAASGVPGSGGSGVVIISYPVGALSVLAVIGATDISAGTPGFTTWRFTSNGYMTISSINS